ncbi:MAG TPA: cation-transporting P-type ATPase, partial [Gaiellaceae bacterium]|nr:cation-transporting P-type ATPase [Gaiellaceae bacterium]
MAVSAFTADRFLDQYEFSCRSCGYAWRETYEVRQVEDRQGGVWEYYSLSGLPASAPAARTVCPHCGEPDAFHRLIERRPAQPAAPDHARAAGERAGGNGAAPPARTGDSAAAGEVLERLGASRDGLSGEEAARRLASAGPNAIPE